MLTEGKSGVCSGIEPNSKSERLTMALATPPSDRIRTPSEGYFLINGLQSPEESGSASLDGSDGHMLA
jgi:hypothetical protein